MIGQRLYGAEISATTVCAWLVSLDHDERKATVRRRNQRSNVLRPKFGPSMCVTCMRINCYELLTTLFGCVQMYICLFEGSCNDNFAMTDFRLAQ